MSRETHSFMSTLRSEWKNGFPSALRHPQEKLLSLVNIKTGGENEKPQLFPNVETSEISGVCKQLHRASVGAVCCVTICVLVSSTKVRGFGQLQSYS